jgi:hypothetical protein
VSSSKIFVHDAFFAPLQPATVTATSSITCTCLRMISVPPLSPLGIAFGRFERAIGTLENWSVRATAFAFVDFVAAIRQHTLLTYRSSEGAANE